MAECTDEFANRLRRYLMRDPFSHNFPVGQEQRVFKLAKACGVLVSDVGMWALGWTEPNARQRTIVLNAMQDVPGGLS